MLSYFLKCRKNTKSKNPRVAWKKKGKIMLLSKCAVCDSKKSKFIKQQKARFLNSVEIKIPSSKILSVVPLLF